MMPRSGRLAYGLLMLPLDTAPIAIVAVAFALISLCYEIGFRLGRWWQDRMPGEQEGPTGMLVGALLGLMAFMLAVTMGMAADRFDARRGLVLAEANADLQAAYLQAEYLPEADTEELRALLREYAPLRGRQLGRRRGRQGRHPAVHRPPGADVGGRGQGRPERLPVRPDVIPGDYLTELVTVSESRVVTGLYARVPETDAVAVSRDSALSSRWSATAPA